MVEFGFFALSLGFSLAVYGLVMGTFSVFRPMHGIILSARNALVAVNWCVIVAALVLWYALLTHDFSVRYAFRNSAVDMPPIYLFTAFWSALEGSHSLWTLIMSTVVSIALLTVRPRNESLMPGLLVAFGIVLTFMLLLTIWASAPLTRLLPAGQFGAGMNALLQNPYMAAHPPSLFAGYCALVVPFGYAVAALIRGAFTPEWLVSFRRWTLGGWAVLTVGIFLGGKWAYAELGWAGYWAWDPVENSSLMPWLATTASIHTLLILDKTNRLPRLAAFLAMFAFILTFMGTFITRSGVISSVHSFAESDIGPAYLIFIVLLLGFALALLSTRGHLLQGAARSNTWTLSKESALLFTNFFLLFLLALVLVGTLLPLIVEAVRGVKISIQQPFFNAFAPWIAIGLVAIIGVGNMLRWRNGRIEDPVIQLAMPALWSLLITAALTVRKDLDVKSMIGFALILWSASVLIMDLVYKLKALRWNGKLFLKFNRPYLGSWVAHLGFLIAITGFIGHYRGIEAQTSLNLGESTQFYGYTLTNKGLGYVKEYNYQVVTAKVQAIDAAGNKALIEPMRSKYTNKEDWLNEVGIESTFWHDVYLVLTTFDPATQKIQLNMHINPTVKLVWTSLVVMVLGALIGLTHRINRRSVSVDPNSLELETATMSLENLIQDNISMPFAMQSPSQSGVMGQTPFTSQKLPGYSTSVVLIAFAVGLALFGFSGVAFAQGTAPLENQQPSLAQESTLTSPKGGVDTLSTGSANGQQAPVTTLNPRLREVGEELRCPTCQGISILESSTPQSMAMKAEIERQLTEGKSKAEILKYFQERYGEWILRKPDGTSAFGKWIWGIPFGGLLLGPIFLVYGLRRSRERELADRKEVVEGLQSFINSQKNSAEVTR